MADDVEMTPITEAEASVPPKVAPFGAAAPAPEAPAPASAAAAPAETATAKTGVTTLKLKPVIRKPMIRKPEPGGVKPAAPAAPATPAAAAKKATQNLKSVTGPIPVQATLKKTGIVAEGIITPAQQQAAKSKTSRISLESAIGVAPVKEAVAPIKTIRLRRPTDLKPQPLGAAPAAPAAPAPTEAAAPAAADQGVTQKKTLKLHRPSGAGIKRPSMGIGGAAPAPAASADAASVPEMAPVSDIPDLAAVSGVPASSSDVPGWVKTLSLITTIAALVTVGVLAYYLYLEGCGPVVGANEMPFLQI